MIVTGKSIDRRALLRGTGAALALPLLDAMTPARAVEATRPIRLGFIEVPNGIMNLNNEFAPKAPGPLNELTPILQPLADFKDRMLVVSGLDNQTAAGLNFEIAGDPLQRAHQAIDMRFGMGGRAGDAQQILRRGRTQYRINVDALFEQCLAEPA